MSVSPDTFLRFRKRLPRISFRSRRGMLTLAAFSCQGNELLHHSLPLPDGPTDEIALVKPPNSRKRTTDIAGIDTIVVPARKQGFEEVFLRECQWYALRLRALTRSQIQYIAVYQVKPISAITHIAPISSIESWKSSDRWVIKFAEAAKEIGPITLKKEGRVKALQSMRFTTKHALDSAKSLDDVW